MREQRQIIRVQVFAFLNSFAAASASSSTTDSYKSS